MKIYNCLYNIIEITNNYKCIQDILILCVNNGVHINELNLFHKYQLGDTVESYTTELISIYIDNRIIGCEILNLICIYIEENALLFKNNLSVSLFINLVDGDVRTLLEDKKYISESEYIQITKDLIDYKKRIQQISREERNQTQMKSIVKVCKVEHEKIMDENKCLKETIKCLESDIKKLKGKYKIKNKKILILSEINISKDMEAIKKIYELQRLKVESSIKSSSNLDELIKSYDIIILCTSDAKHNVFNLIKRSNKRFLTTSTNLVKIFEELSFELGEL